MMPDTNDIVAVAREMPERMHHVEKSVDALWRELNELKRQSERDRSLRRVEGPEMIRSVYVGNTPADAVAHDAYKTGDIVTFNDQVWRSKINANVYSPAAYPAGWELVT